MRCASVYQLKSPKITLAGKKRKQLRPEPRPGTRLRELYDLLQSHKGKPVPVFGFGSRSVLQPALNQLRDFYGLDIRLTKGVRKHGNRIPEFTLVGEWFGKVYIDYMVKGE